MRDRVAHFCLQSKAVQYWSVKQDEHYISFVSVRVWQIYSQKNEIKGATLLNKKNVDAVLTNYNKWGRKFHNHLTVDPVVCTQTQDITHFIGVLKEIDGENKNQYAMTGN